MLFLLVTAPAQASYGDGAPRLTKFYQSFISPYCWRKNLRLHESPALKVLPMRERLIYRLASIESMRPGEMLDLQFRNFTEARRLAHFVRMS